MRRWGGEEEGDDASSMRSSKSGGSKGKGRTCKAPNLTAKLGGQPSAAKPLPAKQAAAHVDARLPARAGAMPEWQKRALAAEGEGLLLRGKLQEAKQRAQAAERQATAAKRERDHLRAHAGKPKPKAGAQGRQEEEETQGGGGRGGDGGRYEVPYGGEPDLEGLGREGEGGALISGQHRALAASGLPKGCPRLNRWE